MLDAHAYKRTHSHTHKNTSTVTSDSKQHHLVTQEAYWVDPLSILANSCWTCSLARPLKLNDTYFIFAVIWLQCTFLM